MDIDITIEEFNAAVAEQDAAWESWGKPIADMMVNLFNSVNPVED